MTEKFDPSRRALLSGAAGALLWSALSGKARAGGARLLDPGGPTAWTAEDSIRLRYFVPVSGGAIEHPHDDPRNGPATAGEDYVALSPDGRHFFTVERWGEIEGAQVARISVYAMADVERFPAGNGLGELKPTLSSTHKSTRSEEVDSGISMGLTDFKWTTDTVVEFLGLDAQGIAQAFRIDVRAATVTQLTQSHSDVAFFRARGQGLIYSRLRNQKAQVLTSAAGPMTRLPLWKRPDDWIALARRDNSRLLLSKFADQKERGLDYQGRLVFLSPSGRYALVVPTFEDVMANGRPYRIMDLQQGGDLLPLEGPVRAEDPKAARRTNVAVLMARLAIDRSELWDADERFLALPVLAPDGSGIALARYDVAGWKPQSLDRSQLLSVDGDWPDFSIHVEKNDVRIERTGDRPGGELISLKGRARVLRKPPATHRPATPGRVALAESINEPQRLVARKAGGERTLIQPDPLLGTRVRRPVVDFEWTDPSGERRPAGYILPDVPPGTRVPLVIQTYFYSNRFFRPDGVGYDPDCAQLLAANGIAVLMLNTVPEYQLGTHPIRLQSFIEYFEAAIAQLAAREKTIDVDRIGMTGFSSSAWQTFTMAAHPGRFPLAAAISCDGVTGDFATYVEGYGSQGARTPTLREAARGIDNVNGEGKSFWDDPATWIRNDNIFNIRNTVTPTLFTKLGGNRSRDWLDSLLTAFAMNDKPCDGFNFPFGSHPLIDVRQRLAMFEIVSDWMGLWLLGRLPPARPLDPERPAKWLALYRMQEKVLANALANNARVPRLPPLTGERG